MIVTSAISFKKLTLYGVVATLLVTLAGCAKEKKKEQMSYEELSSNVDIATKKKKKDEAISYLEEMIGRFSDHHDIAKAKMELAERHFNRRNYAAAHELYEHFNQFYPADAQAEYAKYKSVLAMFHQTGKPYCDQTETENTVKLCREYLQNNHYKTYRNEILNIQQTCENKLFDKEIYVFNFYMRRGKYDAARHRLKTVKDKYLAHNPAFEAQTLYLECKLANKEKNKEILSRDLDTLMKKYPESTFTRMAQGLETKRPFIF
jgi:outer membrane assembly lipoprotein YfiO